MSLHISSTDVRAVEVPDDVRAAFEMAVFNARFISSIQRTGKGGPLGLMAIDCPPLAEFCKRAPEEAGGYTEDSVCAAWYGFRAGLIAATLQKGPAA